MNPREQFRQSAAIPITAPGAAPVATPARISPRAGLVAAWVITALVALDLLGAALALALRR